MRRLVQLIYLTLFIFGSSISLNGYSQTIVNGDFESWTAGVPDGWTTIESGTTITEESTTFHGGSKSASINVTTDVQGDTDFRQSVDVVAATEYIVSVFVYHTEGNQKARLFVGDGVDFGYHTYSDNTIINSWQEVTYTFTASASESIEIGLRFYDQAGFDGEEIVYVDDYTITGGVASTETDILTFILPEQFEAATVDDVNHTVTMEVVNGTALTALTPTITLSAGATIDPASGAVQDFTNAVTYTVTAEDGTTSQNWTVTVTVAAQNTETDILTFVLTEQTGAATISDVDHTVNIEVVFGKDVTALTPTITLSYGAAISPMSGVVGDFTNPVTYTVTAEDGTTTQDWTVTVAIAVEQSGDIFFSEYIEASYGNNKALEIYNSTGATVSLDNYRIRVVHNGVYEDEDFTFAAGAEIANEDVYVVANVEAVTEITSVADELLAYAISTVVSFNGDDARILQKTDDGGTNWTSIDFIGPEATGVDPGDGFDIAGVTDATANHTLLRKQSVTVGNTDWTASAGTNTDDSEWIVMDADIFYFLGYHGPNPANDILTFVLAEQTAGATIDANAHTVDIEVLYGTVVTALVPTITLSYVATVSPESGVVQDFTSPVTYTVTAEDAGTQDWTVTVTVKAPNTETDILTFTLTEQAAEATIDATNHTVDIEVLAGTEVTTLVPTITLSNGATVSPESDATQDFSNAVTYTVTAEDGTTTQAWTVTVTVASVSNETDILAFEVYLVANDTIMADTVVIDTVNHTVNIVVEMETTITALIPVIEVSPGATIDPASDVVQDFTNPISYTVTAQDGITTQVWTVTVTVFEYPVVSIYDIQYTEDASGDSPLIGQTVTTTGIVTSVVPNPDGGFFLQDAPGLWHGIFVYTPTGDIGVVGDSVVFNGEVSEYYGLTELSWVEDYQVISTGHDSPEPVTLTASQMTENIEGVLIHLEEYTCVNVNFDNHDNSLYVNENEPLDTLMVHDLLFEFDPVLNNEYTFTGIGTYDFDNFKIEPRDSADVVILTVVNNPPVIENVYTTPEFPTTGDTEVYILADIKDDVEILTKTFHYGSSLNDLSTEIALEPVGFGGIQFRVILPQFTEETRVYYKFEATDIEYTTTYIDSVDVVVSSEDISSLINGIKIYPNPVIDELHITGLNNISQIIVSTVSGKEILRIENIDNEINIDLSKFNSGLYFISLYSNTGEVGTFKFIKQ